MFWVRITLGLRPRVIRTQNINIFSYCMNKQGVTNIIIHQKLPRVAILRCTKCIAPNTTQNSAVTYNTAHLARMVNV